MSGENSQGDAAVQPASPSTVGATLGLLPVIALSAALTGPAAAQDGHVVLEEISVEGRRGTQAAESYKADRLSSSKFTQPLLDTPRTVTVVTQKQIEERAASSLYDVLRTTPGVTLGTGEGGNPMGDRPFIRGFEASTDMFVDGVRSLGRASYEAFNLEAIEIIKGPAGAYAGRGSTGGSLNMVTKKARLGENFHEFSGLIGTDSQYRGSYDGNVSLMPNLAGRLNLFWQDAEVPGRGIKDDKLGIAGSVVGQVGDATKVTAGFYHSKADSTPDFGIPMANNAFRDRFGAATPDTSYGSGTKDDPYLPIGSANHKQFFGLHNRDFREMTNQAATVTLEHEFTDKLRLESTLAWIGSKQAYIVTRPTFEANGAQPNGLGGPGLQRANRNGQRENRTTAWVTNLSGELDTGFIEHDYVVGFEISKEALRSGSLSGFPGIQPSGAPQGTGDRWFNTPDFLNPDPWIPVDMSGLTYSPLGEPTTTKSRSVYVFDTLKFNEQWMANVGVRFENFHVQQPNGLSRKDNIVTYQLGLVYKPVPYGSIYASFGTSANPSGQCASLAGGSEGAGACTLTANNDDLSPEKNRSFEIGTKWDLLDERLALTAALFRTEKTNQRTTGPLGNVELVGNSVAQGVELGVAGNITEQWAISAGYTYIDAKLTDAGYVNVGTNVLPDWRPSPNTGNRLHYIAPHSFSIWTTYDMTEQWTVGGGATYTGKRFMNADNTSALPSQWRVDLMAAYKVNDKASLQLNVNNVFDEKLYDASHVGLFANTGPGRNATLKLNYRF